MSKSMSKSMSSMTDFIFQSCTYILGTTADNWKLVMRKDETLDKSLLKDIRVSVRLNSVFVNMTITTGIVTVRRMNLIRLISINPRISIITITSGQSQSQGRNNAQENQNHKVLHFIWHKISIKRYFHLFSILWKWDKIKFCTTFIPSFECKSLFGTKGRLVCPFDFQVNEFYTRKILNNMRTMKI
jgi:hypothetical protein